ncbi:glucose 1-dehydrogenase [Rouxiella silvae]|uniref:Glucose 1-dehydrogenase n=1 Tax=Rouxiella silvae TaxID=1646373 RepID=A0AA40X2J7_9GAMM|nr:MULTISPECIES: glucose 1-dehydrogenase [Rouxiella]KAB7896550.1 glucose 1-dehydrogenase [Rouxiella sp. S1S-2]MBF6637129.1 glucose 1-dehydrogenase [Rouxiella silvae]
MSQTLSEKVAVVTGASKGIGAAIARNLALHGASVVVNYASSKAGAEWVVSDIVSRGGSAVAIQGDVSLAEDAQRVIEAAISSFGRLDILVNNAGVYEFNPLESISEDHFHRVFNINVLAPLLTIQAASQHLKEGGSIINIGSNITTMTPPSSTVYVASKKAAEGITAVLAKELGARKIRVNTVSPGPTQTEGTAAFMSEPNEMTRAMIAQTPLGRMGLPEDIASAVSFLASDEAGWITGEVLTVSGGHK